jgi:hypothetical protein
MGCIIHDVPNTAATTSGDEVPASVDSLSPAMMNENSQRQNLALEPVTPVAGPCLTHGILQTIVTAVDVTIEESADGFECASAHERAEALLQLP